MRVGLFLVPLGMIAATPAIGQGIAVHDNASLVQLLNQVRSAGQQLATLEKTYNQAVDAYNNVHGLTNVDSIANVLNSDSSRRWLPSGSRDIEQLMTGSTGSLGQLGEAAANIRAGRKVNLPDLPSTATDTDRATRSALSSNGERVATNAAVADAAFNATTTRTEGLEQLRQALSTASTQKEVQDLQARIAIEEAHIQNDAMQLQAVKMRQDAEDRLQGQQAMERAAALRAADAAKFGNQ